MTVRKLFPMCVLLALCGCQPRVVVPTAKDLVADRQLLKVWQGKCDTGEYSHLPADQKATFCSTTADATISVAQEEAGKKEADFFDKSTRRK